MKFRVWGVAAVAVTLSLIAPAADAAFVGINAPARGEMSHKQIFASTYGGTFRYAGANLTNGTITATRVSDAEDATFGAGTYTARAIAKFSGGNENFGVVQNGQFQKLLTATANRSSVAMAGAREFTGPVSFAQNTGRTQTVFSTDDAANVDKADHAVTYKLTGLDFGGEVYVLFFENRINGKSDKDYNDLVVQVNRAIFAPTPAAAAMGISLLAGLTLRRRRA